MSKMLADEKWPLLVNQKAPGVMVGKTLIGHYKSYQVPTSLCYPDNPTDAASPKSEMQGVTAARSICHRMSQIPQVIPYDAAFSNPLVSQIPAT